MPKSSSQSARVIGQQYADVSFSESRHLSEHFFPCSGEVGLWQTRYSDCPASIFASASELAGTVVGLSHAKNKKQKTIFLYITTLGLFKP